MARNRERDEHATATAEDLGWIVVRVWECEIMTDPQAAAWRVLEAAER
jgi:DNA mismatch endonuclease (patch repair protein)